MKRKTFNIIASATAFAFGAIFLFSDSASITANVIGSSGSGAGFASIIGIFMIISSMILFEVSMNSADIQALDLERLIRGTKNQEVIFQTEKTEPDVEIHKAHHEHHLHEKKD
jgi:hypothetical protein